MSAFADYLLQAELALAAYVNLAEGAPDRQFLQDAGMAVDQANSFASRWRVIDQYNHTTDPYPIYDEITGEFLGYDTRTNGLSVTVFEEVATGKRYLAIRGTDDAYDLAIDAVSVALRGTTRFQAQYQSLKSKVKAWLDDGTLGPGFTVAGHSLGGFLATGLLADFGANVGYAGKPRVDRLRGPVWEVRSSRGSRIARTLFAVDGYTMILLHGFIKKTQRTPAGDLEVAEHRFKEWRCGET